MTFVLYNLFCFIQTRYEMTLVRNDFLFRCILDVFQQERKSNNFTF